ncbi:MAG TPA: TIM barrel protein [Caldilineaceae bacterium]|nr:TIM barrel protein [Caldilineaceae bacterium]
MQAISVGNAPCSWGTLEFSDTQGERFTYHQMLDELAATGYTGSELGDWGFMPTEPESLAEEFRRRRLALTGAFVGVALKYPEAHARGQEMAVQTARLLAETAARLDQEVQPFLVLADANCTDPVRTLNAGRITPEMGLSEQEWQTFAGGAERIARAIRDTTGLRTVFHHHCGGYVETPDEIGRLLEMTDPELVGLVFDTGHYAFGAGGCETLMAALERYRARIWYVHFKDCDPNVLRRAQAGKWDYFESVRQGVFCELGKGCVDFAAVASWLRRHEYRGFITVEQDVLPGMGTPKQSAQRNREYLLSIGL